MKHYKIKQDRDLCLGCGRCQMLNPDNWEIDDDDYKAKPKKEIIDETEYQINQQVTDECPVQCIKLEEIDSGNNDDDKDKNN
jgi:ferredoxin